MRPTSQTLELFLVQQVDIIGINSVKNKFI